VGMWDLTSLQRCDEQLRNFATLPGLSSFDEGLSENILIPSYRFLIKVG
jgi:hypothetical protein